MLGIHKSTTIVINVGDEVELTYNDKPRTGAVEKVEDSYFTVDTQDGFRSFTYSKVQGDIVITQRESEKGMTNEEHIEKLRTMVKNNLKQGLPNLNPPLIKKIVRLLNE